MSLKSKNTEIQKSNQNKLRKLEEFYNTNEVESMMVEVEAKKEELVKQMIEYSSKHTVACKWDEDGNPIAFRTRINPLIITNYFFKPITPISSQEPVYNAERLGMVFDYYCDILAEVNDKIGDFPSSLTSFCKLAGITLSTLRSYRNSRDLNMRVIAEKIYDQIGDANITMSQMGMVKERSTIFKMKSENEMVEKQQPNVNINIVEQPDLKKIEEKLNKYKMFATKKEK